MSRGEHMLRFRNPKTRLLLSFRVLLCLTAGTLVQAQSKPLVYVRHWEQFYYPPLASAARLEGTVRLKLSISPDGRVVDATSLNDESTPKPKELLLSAATALVTPR